MIKIATLNYWNVLFERKHSSLYIKSTILKCLCKNFIGLRSKCCYTLQRVVYRKTLRFKEISRMFYSCICAPVRTSGLCVVRIKQKWGCIVMIWNLLIKDWGGIGTWTEDIAATSPNTVTLVLRHRLTLLYVTITNLPFKVVNKANIVSMYDTKKVSRICFSIYSNVS